MKKWIILILIIFLNCSSVMSSRTGIGVRAGGYEEKDQISTEFTLYGESGEEQIKKAKHLSSLGKFNEAVIVLKAVIKDNPGTVFSDQANFEIGKIYSNIINPGKDFRKAKLYYRIVIENPPESEFDEQAKSALKNIERFLESQEKK